MNSRNNKAVLLALGLFLNSQVQAFAWVNPQPSPAVLAVEKTPGTIGAIERLDDIEEVIYGEPRKYLTTDARLKELETKLFGKAQSGTYETRLAKITQTLSFGSTSVSNGSSSLKSQKPALDAAEPVSKSTNLPNTLPKYQVDSSAALEEAMRLYSEGKLDDAEAAFHAIIARDSQNADAYYNLGVIQEGRSDFAGALSNYRRAQSLNPQESDYRQAVSALELKLGPAFSDKNSAKHSVAHNTGTTKPAEALPPLAPPRDSGTFAEANAKNGTVAGFEPIKATKAADKKLVEQATADFKAARYDAAIDKLKRVAANNPNDADVQYAIGQAYRAKGDMIGAMSYLSRASSLAPQNRLYADAIVAARSDLSNPNGNFNPQASASRSNSDDGGLQPFANSKANESTLTGKASASDAASRRIKRAITYGVAGAATSVLASTLLSRGGAGRVSSRRLRNAAIGGAAVGGLMGLMFGK